MLARTQHDLGLSWVPPYRRRPFFFSGTSTEQFGG